MNAPARMQLAQILCRSLPPILGQQLRELVYPSGLGRTDNFNFTVKSQTGSLYSGNTADYMTYPFGVCGYHSFRLWAIAIAVTATGDTIVEIGANVGTETVGFADIVGSSGKVVAVEPLAANLERLEQMIRLNRFTHVDVIPMAVAEHPGKTSFVLPNVNNSGVGFITNDTKLANSIEISVTTLNELAPAIGKAALVAIDVEGAELSVLRGGKEWLLQARPVIALEANERHQQRNGSSLKELATYIASLQYSIFSIERLGLQPCATAEIAASSPGDWVCFPPGADKQRKAVEGHLRSCFLMPCLPYLNPMTGINTMVRKRKISG